MGDHDPVSPTVKEYIVWAQDQGCTISYNIQKRTALRILRIVAPSGRHAAIGGLMDDQIMTPATVSQTDRRLGLDSPFLKLPEPNIYSGDIH